MHESLERNVFLVKEHVGMFKAANEFDIHDPETGEVVLQCREPKLGVVTKLLRFTDYKRMTPFRIVIQTPEGEPVVGVSRGVAIFLSKVQVTDERDEPIGSFKQKFSIGGKFAVLDPDEAELCELKGKWTGWEFKFAAGDKELARVTKKWSGVGKEMFTSADNYVLQIADDVPPDNPVRQLILAAVMCIDMVLKE
ncbi:MAG: LURP-one-related/scramblase family protein [Planctomycetota bacterium]